MHWQPEVVALIASGRDGAVAEFLRKLLRHLLADGHCVHVAEDTWIERRLAVIYAQAAAGAVEDVVVEAVISSGETHDTHNGSGMRRVVRGVSVGNRPEGNVSADDIVDESGALGHIQESGI